MQAKLDAILDLTREYDPVDELFVGRVMVRVRADAQRRSRRRRTITRPAILGVAAVLVGAGAVAALVRSVVPNDTRDVNISTTRGTGVDARPSGETRASAPKPDLPTQAVSGVDGRSATYRHDDLEWGYTSAHSAYVLDTRTGLRLQTETYRNEVTAGRPHAVTLTLANLGKRPIAIYAPEGCALSVVAYHGDSGSGDPSAFRDPTDTKDPQRSSTWCAARGTRDPEKFVLQPGDIRTTDIRVVLGRTGNWAVLGMCRCSYGRATSGTTPRPTPEKDAIDQLGRIGIDVPRTAPLVGSDDGNAKRLFTPPIQVQAR